MSSRRTRELRKKPIAGRFCVLGVWLISGGVHAQALTEQQAVARALAQPALVEHTQALVDAERGRAEASGARPNPQLNYVREQTYKSNGTSEDYGSVSQTLHLGARYRLRREAGEARAHAREQEGRVQQIAVASEVRALFYGCLHSELRLLALRQYRTQVEQTLNIVERREQRGDATQYDRRRLERERTTIDARLEAEQAHSLAAKVRLAALLALDGKDLALSGSLLPDADPEASDELHARALHRPDLLALEHEQLGARAEAQAAARTSVPELRLEAGYKGVELNTGGRTDGFMAGGSLSIPLWDRGTGLKRSFEAQARALAAEKARLAQRLEGELNGARVEAAGLRAAARTFRELSLSTARDLVRIATAGYEGGELSLLELLDAYRGAAEDALSVLDMELASRRAFIELDRLTGARLP